MKQVGKLKKTMIVAALGFLSQNSFANFKVTCSDELNHSLSFETLYEESSNVKIWGSHDYQGIATELHDFGTVAPEQNVVIHETPIATRLEPGHDYSYSLASGIAVSVWNYPPSSLFFGIATLPSGEKMNLNCQIETQPKSPPISPYPDENGNCPPGSHVKNFRTPYCVPN